MLASPYLSINSRTLVIWGIPHFLFLKHSPPNIGHMKRPNYPYSKWGAGHIFSMSNLNSCWLAYAPLSQHIVNAAQEKTMCWRPEKATMAWCQNPRTSSPTSWVAEGKMEEQRRRARASWVWLREAVTFGLAWHPVGRESSLTQRMSRVYVSNLIDFMWRV